MSDPCHRRETCRLCGGTDLTEVLSLAPTPPANAFVAADKLDQTQETFPLDLFFCEHCGHVQLLDVVDPRVLFENYVYVSGTSPIFVKHFDDYARFVIDAYRPDSGSLVLDIGSNDGTLLRFFKDRGFSVLGVDPAKNIAAKATADGIETITGFFTEALAEKILSKRGPATVVTANNVFAHADDMGGIVGGIRALLADDGVFVFEVSYLVDVYTDTLFDTIYHEHVAYHSVGPLKAFFEANGMELIAAHRVDSHGGSLRGVVQLQGGGGAVDESVGELMALETDLGLDKSGTLKDFARKIDAVKQRLNAELARIKADGKTVAGFGAPAKATTLMYHFGIGPEVIDFIVDDSPLKQGLYTPGLHVPVLASDALYGRKPDYVIILAWNFAQAIMDKHAAYAEAGGRFIVPLPRVEIY